MGSGVVHGDRNDEDVLHHSEAVRFWVPGGEPDSFPNAICMGRNPLRVP